MEGARSMIRTGIPSFVRRRAWKRPTGPPPEIRIGVVEDEVMVEEVEEEDDMFGFFFISVCIVVFFFLFVLWVEWGGACGRV